MLTAQEISSLVLIVRRAPLHNMDEAETVSKLLDKMVHTLRGVLSDSIAKASPPTLPELRNDDKAERSGP